MNPIHFPHNVGREVECGRGLPTLVDIATHLLNMLRDIGGVRWLVRCTVYEYGAGSEITRTRVDVLYRETLEPLNNTGPEFQPALGFVDETQYFIELKQAIPCFQIRFLLGIAK